MTVSPQEVTQLLAAWRGGDPQALDKLMPLVYDELRRIASRYMKREHPGHTLQTTALVNEAYLRMVGQQNVDWQNRAHFFGVAASVMRHLLVDRARANGRVRRGGNPQQVTLDEAAVVSEQKGEELLALDEALTKLNEIDERKVKIVELRYFSGLSAVETAEVLGVSEITVKREWLKAKAWLYRELTFGTHDEG
ncbi:MAG TPA: sigma-70 family RNA polymerase sigma factor [Blastocatellia bacterium]|nr:sigma-70 family RNA polymerase sigma factor [Blastocatellia bacterium]